MRAALARGEARLRDAGVPSPRRETALLLAWILETDRGGLVLRGPEPLPADAADRFESLLRRREAREPFQYVVGEAEFRGRSFSVDRRVLVPRPETELLVDEVLALDLRAGARVVDLGTGSGCIAVTIALERPDLELHAVDLSTEALEVARSNAARHGVLDRIRFARVDLGSPRARLPGPFDAIVSNPPYVAEDEWRSLAPEVRDHEPREALVPGPTGLEAYAAVASTAAARLGPGGALVLELGYRSREGAVAALREAGLEVEEVRRDPRGIPRVLRARKVEVA